MDNFYSDEFPDFFKKPENFHLKSNLLISFPIGSAAWRGDIAQVKKLIALGVDIDCKGDMGRTPLHDAISAGHTEMAKLLIENHADVTINAELGGVALDLARLKGNQEIVDILEKIAPEQYFADANDIFEKYLLEEDFSTEQMNFNVPNIFGYLPLQVAVLRHAQDEVKIFLQAGANVDCQSCDGLNLTPLHLAIGIGDFSIMKILLKAGADTTLLTGFGYSSMDIAMRNGNQKIIFYLYSWLK